MQLTRPISGHVFRFERKRGPVWYAKHRLPDGTGAETDRAGREYHRLAPIALAPRDSVRS
jgi:hypothetical protein